MATIFKLHLSLSHSSDRKSSKYRTLPNFELKLEIPNIMLVCKFEINWSTNKNLRALTTYLGRRPTFPYPPLHFAGNKNKLSCTSNRNIHFCPTGTLLKTGRITDYNTPNQCQPLICAKDHCV